MAYFIINFLVSLVVSTLIIFLVTKFFGEKESLGTAFTSALIGTIIYTLVFYFFGRGLIATLSGGIAWLIALGNLYRIGWFKSFIIALIIWLIANLISYFLPTLTGPL